ncbi:MAG: ankyrin repeat domain-containing protein, partial [Pseudomonadales bacterium]|nr:ankyrin repeat domain-containing protein [Pseudomonadales bacterium]
ELLSTTDSFERTALMIAVEEHSLEWVAHLVKNSTLLDMQDKSGSTALHYAIHGKSKIVTKLLLDAGANPDIGTFDEERPLHLAIASKQLALANLLLKAGADVSLKNSSGWTPTTLAKRSNDKNIRAALKIDASNSNIRLQRISEVQNLEKLFVDAVRRGDRELTEKLLNQGIDISSAEANGYTPLAHAVLNGQRDIVPLLLNRGARTDTVFAQKQNLLHLAAKSSNADTLPLLITHSLDINATDAFHKTPLVLATQAGCEQCVTFLLRNGASAQIQDNDGKTPLIHALINRRASIAKLLLTQPDKHNLTDNAGRNALWWATKRGYLDIALNLLNSSTAPSLDLSKFNALHVAAEENHPALVEPLMELVNIDLKTRSGNTPLLLAAHAGSTEALVLLIEAGANLDMPNARGDTALISAAKSENLECAKLLLDAGANPSIRNRNFESAFSIIELRNKPTGMMLIENYDGKLAKLL